MQWLQGLIPEIWLFVFIIYLLFFVGLYKNKKDLFVLYITTNFSLVFLFLLLLFQFYLITTNSDLIGGNLNVYIGDLVIYSNGTFELFSKLVISLVAIFVNIMFKVYFDNLDVYRFFKVDMLPLYFIILLGSFVVISSNDFITFLIGFELIAVPSYFIIAMDNKNSISLEGSMKYFLIGSIATISILISILIFYIYSGSLVFGSNLVLLNSSMMGIKIAFILLVLGLLIKLAIFPLSFWIQDAYFASRGSYLLVISSLPKLAIAFFLVKLIYLSDFHSLKFLSLFLALSMIMGTFWALTTNDLKKILAFSTITNMSYSLIPIVSVGYDIFSKSQALTMTYFYILQYVLASILFIAVLIYLEGKFGRMDLNVLRGVIKENPVLAWFLIISLVSMAGLPPTVGFVSKFLLFSYSYSFSPLLVWIGIITSVISLYFYYKIAQYLYIKEGSAQKINIDFLTFFSNSLLSALILFLGFLPTSVISVIQVMVISLM